VSAFGRAYVALSTVTAAIATALGGLAAAGGAALVGVIQSGTGAVPRTVQSVVRERLSVRDFGAVGEGVADDTAAIQAAIEASKVAGAYKAVWFPAGKYRITYAINLATGSGHDHNLVQLVGEGCSWNGAALIGETGGMMIDCTGSSDIRIQGLLLKSGTTNPSTLGILFARGAASTYCANAIVRDVQIYINSAPAANGGVGSVGICNVAGEQHVYDRTYVWANLPLILTVDPNPVGLAPIPSVYTPQIASVVSLGVTNITGTCSLATLDFHRPAIYFNGVNTVRMDGAYIGAVLSQPGETATPAGTHTVAFEVWNAANLHLTGTAERHSQCLRNPRNISDSVVDMVMGDPRTANLPYIDITPEAGGTQGTFNNTDISIFTVEGNTQLFTAAGGAATTAALANCVVHGTDALPTNILVNSKNVELHGPTGVTTLVRAQYAGGRQVPNLATGYDEFNTRFDVGTVSSLGVGFTTDHAILQAFDRSTHLKQLLAINPFGGVVQIGDDVELTPFGAGIFMRSASGTRYVVTVSNAGTLTVVPG
jgi:hypothetical protein